MYHKEKERGRLMKNIPKSLLTPRWFLVLIKLIAMILATFWVSINYDVYSYDWLTLLEIYGGYSITFFMVILSIFVVYSFGLPNSNNMET